MFTSGNLEAKISLLAAIQKLCTVKENVERLINSGIISYLLQLPFLSQPAAAMLACLAQSELILMKKNIVEQMLSLLNISSPVIQCHLLQALSSISDHPGAFNINIKGPYVLSLGKLDANSWVDRDNVGKRNKECQRITRCLDK
ncbi:hypothetical protein Taro_050557 [Colocasia esculenta]|uniref:Uncharacterized protein n=1 Tax=Colocasia esculenta TaxID=4460 RepID=A0A843XEC0_COLES|nr:hypothetical protein [Colocasia esculenta]